MPASKTYFLSAGSGLRELVICKVVTSVGKPLSASICSRLSASASGSGGNSVCAVKTHFSGTPKTQWRSRTPAASSWLRISRPTSSGAAVSGSSVRATEKLCCTCSEPFTRRSTTPSSRLPSSARPSTVDNFFRFRNLIFKCCSWRCVVRQQSLPRLVAQRPAEPAQVLAVKNDGRPFAGVKNEFHAPVAATERPDRRDVGGELVTLRGDDNRRRSPRRQW